jgi:hypothetical protein
LGLRPFVQSCAHVRRESVPRADVVRPTCGVKFCNMDRKELEVEVERLLLKKKARRRKLTKREELILAYTHYAGGCLTCYAMVKVQR